MNEKKKDKKKKASSPIPETISRNQEPLPNLNQSQDWSKSQIDEMVRRQDTGELTAVRDLNSGFEQKLKRMATSRSS